MERFIPILSLLIAAIAVFVGPAISVYIAKRQIRASSEIANEQIRMTLKASSKQITAPMRQAWINCLRNLLAEISSSALHYYVAGFEERIPAVNPYSVKNSTDAQSKGRRSQTLRGLDLSNDFSARI
jgi:uncharacterized protein YneF (UPF0154 family)